MAADAWDVIEGCSPTSGILLKEEAAGKEDLV